MATMPREARLGQERDPRPAADPEPREIHHTVISVDDHLVEPPGMFEGRLPARFEDAAPRIVETEEGHEVWEFDGQIYFQVGLQRSWAGHERTGRWSPPASTRCGRAATRSTPESGTWTSTGCGPRSTSQPDHRLLRFGLRQLLDPQLGLAVTRAWNDWFFEEWYSRAPERIVPEHHVPGRRRPSGGRDQAQRRSRVRGGHAARTAASRRAPQHLLRLVGPHRGGLRRDRHRDLPPRRVLGRLRDARGSPISSWGRPCSGSSRSGRAPSGCGRVRRKPDLKIAMSEGGIGWVAMLIDRLDNMVERSGYGQVFPGDLPRARYSAATSGSAPSTTRPPSPPATSSGGEHLLRDRLPPR